jgi:hypothetical protein
MEVSLLSCRGFVPLCGVFLFTLCGFFLLQVVDVLNLELLTQIWTLNVFFRVRSNVSYSRSGFFVSWVPDLLFFYSDPDLMLL